MIKYISHSSRLFWNQCHKKYYWNQVRRLERKEIPSAFLRGIAGHKVVDAWLKADKSEEVKEHILQTVTPTYPELGGALKAYFVQYKDEAITYTQHAEPFATSLGTLHNHEWLYVGESDGVVEYKDSLWVIERKFTSQIPSDLVGRFQLDDQIQGYVWEKRKSGIPVKGALLDIVRCTKYPSLVRDFVVLNDSALASFEQDIKHVVEEIATAEDKNHYPPSPHSCFVFGECPYRLLCLNPDRANQPEMMNFELKQITHEEGVHERATRPS